MTPEEHRDRLCAVKHEIRDAVHEVLKKHDLPLHLHSLKLTADPKAVGSFNCCIINGMFHCGPECP